MRRNRSSLAVLVASGLAATVLLGGCSGGDSSDGDADASPTRKPRTTEEARTQCEADVEITGAVKQSWSGEGFVITENQSGPVLYRAEKGRTQLTLLSAEGEFDALGQLRVGAKSYTTQADGTLEVDDQGTGAEVDADATGTDGNDRVHITATIDC